MDIPVHNDAYWAKRSFKSVVYLAWQVICGMPKSIIFNLKYFGLKGLKLPVLCSYKVKLSKLRGYVEVNSRYHFGMIKLGFTAPEMYDNHKLSFVWVNDGLITFKGTAGIRNGVAIRNYGYLTFGNEFHVSSPSTIICYKKIIFGDDVLIGWNCEFTDGDAHKIYAIGDEKKKRLNEDKTIIIGDHVWVAANVKVLKGTVVGNNVVIAAGSILTKPIQGDNQIIGGHPARVIKEGINWYV